VGLPYPNWLERDGALISGKIRGNPQFGLEADQTLNLIAAQAPRDGGELATSWLWFLENGVGMLFSDGNHLNPLSHNLQLIDYNLFMRDASCRTIFRVYAVGPRKPRQKLPARMVISRKYAEERSRWAIQYPDRWREYSGRHIRRAAQSGPHWL
jgi:hypothetical protein